MEFQYAFSEWDLLFGALSVRLRAATSFDGKGISLLEAGPRIRSLPIGSSIWPSALALAEVLARDPVSVDGKRVLDLGCGAGLCSVVAARLGAFVTASDVHMDMPELVNFNAALNNVKVEYAHYAWESDSVPGQFDVVIGSDVLYEAQQCNTVLDALARTLAPGGRAVITDPGRKHLERFELKAHERGFACTREKVVIDDVTHPSASALLKLHPRVPGPFHLFRLQRGL